LNQGTLEELTNSVTNLMEIDAVKKKTENALQQRLPAKLILDALNKGMRQIGQKYEEGEYFLSELIFAAEILKAGVDVLKPRLVEGDLKASGTIVVGTVKGDLHDLGKSLFVMFAGAAGFTIDDLGIDVPADTFVERITKVSADIVAMSALMSTTKSYMKDIIDACEKAGLRRKIKVIIGGASITDKFGEEIGADAAVTDAVKGAEICSQWMGHVEP